MPSVRRVFLGSATATLMLLVPGCGDFEASASAQGIAPNNMISELAASLDGSSSLTYAASYQLDGGGTASVVQDHNPHRTAYGYPGGRVLVTDSSVTSCAGATCTVTTAPTTGGALPGSTFAAAQRAGMVAPGTVLALLNAAALDTAVTVTTRDTTIAGHHATCVELGGVDDARATDFTTCVTNDGVLGSFAGELDGARMDIAMTAYSGRVPADAFSMPANAHLIDKR